MSIRDLIEKRLREQKERDAGSSQFSRDARNAVQGSIAGNLLTSAVLSPVESMSNVSRVNNALDPFRERIGNYFTGQGNQEKLSKAKQAALRGESIEIDPDQTNLRLSTEGLDLVNLGLAGADEVPDKAVIEEAVIEESGPSVDQMTGRSLLLRALENSRTPIDMQSFEQLAEDRNRAGDLSTLTSLYAGEAGPRYDDYKKSYLTKAREEQGQQQLGDYGIASGGAFYETPGIQQGREEKADFDAANLLFDAEEADAKRLNKTLTANQYNKLMEEADTSQVALDKLDGLLATFEVEDGGVDRGFTVWTDQVTADAKTFFGKQADRDQFRLKSREAQIQQIIGLFRTDIVGPGVVTEYDAERILKSVGGNVGILQNPDIVRQQIDILRQQKIKALNRQKRQLDYFSRSYPGLYNSSVIDPGVQGSSSPSSISAGAGRNTYEVNY